MTGIEYPTITIGDRTLVVRFSLASQYVMSRRGIDARKFSSLLSLDNPGAVGAMFDIFACAVAENFVDPKATPETFSVTPPTADYWAFTVPPEQWKEVCGVVNLAMVKASADLRAAKQALPETPPN